MGLRGQTEQTPTSGSGIGSDTICNDPAQPCRYCPLRVQGALTALKRVYKVERSPYLYSARKFLPYPMWDVTSNDPVQPCRYCPLRAQGAFTVLKRVYKVERSPYLYSARKFLPYPMWDVTNTPPMQTQRPRCIPWDCGAKRNKPPHRGRGSALIPFVTTRSNHVVLSASGPRGLNGFKTRLQG